MKTFALAFATLLILACQPADDGDTALDDVSAGGESSGLAERCLAAVDDGLWNEALDLCQQALAEAPDSEAVSDALARAREEAASAADDAADALRQSAD